MIIIINGSVGVGKSSVSWALAEKLGKSVMLDGDYIGAIFPRDYKDPDWLEYLYKTFANSIHFHKGNGFEQFVINYVFETAESLAELKQVLAPIDDKIKSFLLVCAEDEQRQRILSRNSEQVDWELKRFVELNEILESASIKGNIGQKIDTSTQTIQQTVVNIFNSL